MASHSPWPLLLLLLLAVWIGSLAAQSLFLPVGHDAALRSSDGSSCPSSDPTLYYRPVIGILTHPGDGASGRLSNATNASNIPASYVKFIESAGARVIPLIYNEPQDLIIRKLNLVNGVLFTGGWAKTGLYYDVANKIFEEILARNDAGDHFPLFAICLGFELLNMFISQNHDICERFAGEDQASTLQFSISETNGTLFQRFPQDLLTKMSTECLAMQNHMVRGPSLRGQRLLWLATSETVFSLPGFFLHAFWATLLSQPLPGFCALLACFWLLLSHYLRSTCLLGYFVEPATSGLLCITGMFLGFLFCSAQPLLEDFLGPPVQGYFCPGFMQLSY